MGNGQSQREEEKHVAEIAAKVIYIVLKISLPCIVPSISLK